MNSDCQLDLLGITIDHISVIQLHNTILEAVVSQEHIEVLNVNVHCLNLAYNQPWLRDYLNRSDYVFCDGMGVILGAKLLGHTIRERITYADWMWQLAELSAAKGLSLFFLGAQPGVTAKAGLHLQSKYPDLRVVGVHHGYFNKDRDSSENQDVIDKINAVRPNILVVGFGMPLQERWLMENWCNIDANVALTGGAVFDYISGDLKRAPRWMTDNGFEWLGRMLIEPKRLWRRYILGNPVFIWRVLKQRVGMLHLPK